MPGPWDALTERERDVLDAVGRRLGNPEIAAEFHISLRTVESHIAALRRKLAVDSRAALVEAARQRRASAVPVPQTSFVGRDREREELERLIGTLRWVTIVGPAGCGKTRLALEVAARSYRVPVIVDLEQAGSDDVLRMIAGGVGLVNDSSADLLMACAIALEAHQHLLVLDNCDLIGDAAARVTRGLLARVPALAVLATSRTPLGAADETVFDLAPLEAAASARLFRDRIRSGGTADPATVARICARLDGLPLAIELAAARARVLDLDTLDAELARDVSVIAGPGSSRHSTLDAAFAWTWDQLPDPERGLLSRLAALPNAFDLGLAEGLVSDAAGAVLGLVDRSLLVAEGQRFRMLAVIRQLVLARTDPRIVDEVRRAHAEWFDARAAELYRRARTDDSVETIRAVERGYPDFAAALSWALDADGDLALRLGSALAVFMEQYGTRIDVLESLAAITRRDDLMAVASIQQLQDIGEALSFSDMEAVDRLAALALARADSPAGELAARELAGVGEAYRGHGRAALEHLDEAVGLAEGDPWRLGRIHQIRGVALKGREVADPVGALAAFELAIEQYAIAGDRMHVNNVRYMMATVAADLGTRLDEAIAWADECVAYGESHTNRHEHAHGLIVRASLTAGEASANDLEVATTAFRAIGDLRCLARSYLLLARRRGRADRIPLLTKAHRVAASAFDDETRAITLERLAREHWAQGSRREAYLAFGELIATVGRERAERAVPAELVAEAGRWAPTILEGRSSVAAPA